jgi:hypothetical protein
LNGNCSSCGCLHSESSAERVKESPLYKSFTDDTTVLGDLMNMGYREDGRKIGVGFRKKYGKNSTKWYTEFTFQKIQKLFFFNTYEEALEKRLDLQEEI